MVVIGKIQNEKEESQGGRKRRHGRKSAYMKNNNNNNNYRLKKIHLSYLPRHQKYQFPSLQFHQTACRAELGQFPSIAWPSVVEEHTQFLKEYFQLTISNSTSTIEHRFMFRLNFDYLNVP